MQCTRDVSELDGAHRYFRNDSRRDMGFKVSSQVNQSKSGPIFGSPPPRPTKIIFKGLNPWQMSDSRAFARRWSCSCPWTTACYMQVATRPLFVTDQVLNSTKNQSHPRMAERPSALPSRFKSPETFSPSNSNYGEQKIAKKITRSCHPRLRWICDVNNLHMFMSVTLLISTNLNQMSNSNQKIV